MDNFLENVSGYSMWDLRNAIEKVTAKVMNYTEMEQKVREATSNEAWLASGTLKQDLAQATNNFQQFNEIMAALFKRFTEREPREWRILYKSLVLLEYLVTHGSERVVDEARGHISTVKVLRNFQYVDDNGKDEGINVRNRAKEFAEMLSSVDRIKEERKKAKANRNKYIGTEGGSSSGGSGGFAGTGSKYGGFGSDSYFDGGSGSGSSYRGNSRYDDQSSSRSGRYDDDDRDTSDSPPVRRTSRKTEATKTTSRVESVKEVNLFDFDEPVTSAPVSQSAFGSNTSKPVDDAWGSLQSATDDFDDFQSAPPIEQKSSAPIPAFSAYTPTMASVLPVRTNSNSSNINSKPANVGAFDLLGSSPVKSSTFSGSGIPPLSASSTQSNPSSRPSSTFLVQSTYNNSTSGNAPSNDIWASASGLISLDGLGREAKTREAAPSMNALAANTWNSGAWANKPSTPIPPTQGSFGNFGGMASQPAKKNNHDFDDLLS